MSEEQSVNSEIDSESGAGAKLRQTREMQNLTLQDISDSIKVSIKVIHALESENLEQLPEATYVYGYLKSYAKLLGLPSQEIIERFPGLRKKLDSKASETPVFIQKDHSSLPHNQQLYVISLAILGGLVMLWLVAQLLFINNPAQVRTHESNRVSPLVEQQNQNMDEGNESKTTPVSPGGQPESTKSEAGKSPTNKIPENPPTADPKTASSDPSKTAIDPTPKQAEPTLSTIRIEFIAECWLEIVDQRGKQLFYKLGQPGQTRTVRGVPPFQVVIGDVTAVELKYQGNPVSIKSSGNRRSSKMTIGKMATN